MEEDTPKKHYAGLRQKFYIFTQRYNTAHRNSNIYGMWASFELNNSDAMEYQWGVVCQVNGSNFMKKKKRMLFMLFLSASNRGKDKSVMSSMDDSSLTLTTVPSCRQDPELNTCIGVRRHIQFNSFFGARFLSQRREATQQQVKYVAHNVQVLDAYADAV